MRARRLVQPVAQLLAGLEERDVLFRDLDAVASARVAPDAGIAALDREGAEAAQLDPIAARQGRADLVEDGGDDDLDIALVEMRVGFSKPLHELRFGHDRHARWQMGGGLPCQTHPPASRRGPAGARLAPAPPLSSCLLRWFPRSCPRLLPGVAGSPRRGCRRGWHPSPTN